MSLFSRRTFIQRTGVASVGVLLGSTRLDHDAPAVPDLTERWGRTFGVTPVRGTPDLAAPIVRTLHPDAVTPILHTLSAGRWYQVPGGYVPRSSLQPIQPFTPTATDEPVSSIGGFAEVIAPVSAVRTWAGAYAPIRARVGQGAVVYVADRLTDDRGLAWYALTASHESPILGWSPSAHFAPLKVATTAAADLRLHMDMAEGRLVVLHGDRMLAQVPVALVADDSPLPFGTACPLALMSAGLTLLMYGAYWHNGFVREPQENRSIQEITGKVRVELPTYAARWLRQHSNNGAGPLAVTFG